MKEIINGKTYNTDTAELVASGDNGLSYSDCWRQTEELYLTRKGNYFIVDANSNFVLVNKDGSLQVDLEFSETTTIFDWLEAWSIGDIEDREKQAFGITEG